MNKFMIWGVFPLFLEGLPYAPKEMLVAPWIKASCSLASSPLHFLGAVSAERRPRPAERCHAGTGRFSRIFRDPQGHGTPYPYYSYGNSMGPAYHKGVPLLGVPGITLDRWWSANICQSNSTTRSVEWEVSPKRLLTTDLEAIFFSCWPQLPLWKRQYNSKSSPSSSTTTTKWSSTHDQKIIPPRFLKLPQDSVMLVHILVVHCWKVSPCTPLFQDVVHLFPEQTKLPQVQSFPPTWMSQQVRING